MALKAGQLQRFGVIALADGATTKEARLVTHDDDGQFARRRSVHGGSEAGVVVALDGATCSVDEFRHGEAGRFEGTGERVQNRRNLEAEWEIGIAGEHMVRKRVTTLKSLGPMGVGADDRHLREWSCPPFQRQYAVVREQHDGFLGESAGQLPMARRVKVDVRRRLTLKGVRIEKPQFFLLRESTQHRAVDIGHIELSRTDAISQGLQIGVAGWQFDVDSRFERQRRCLASIGRDGMHDLKESHCKVVGDDNAGESDFLAKYTGEVVAIGRHRNSVDVGIRIHDGLRAAVEDRHLERRQEDVRDLSWAGVYRCMITTGARCGVSEEVFQRRMHPSSLKAAHVRRADGADEIGILSDALIDPTPAGVTDHVEHGGQPLVNAQFFHRLADDAGHLLDQRWVERGAPGERCRERGRLPCGESGQALFVHERGDSQSRLALEAALLTPQPGGAFRRLNRACAIDAGVVPDAMPGHLGEVGRRLLPRRHLTLHGCDDAVLVQPVADDLSELLFESHPSVERAYAFRHLGHS